MTPTRDLVAPRLHSTSRYLRRLAGSRSVRGLSPLAVLPDGFGSEVLAVPGELLVRRRDLDSAAVRRFVAAHELRVGLVPGLAGRVARLTGRTLGARLPEILLDAQARRLPVTAHHVAAMAGLIKALNGPVPAVPVRMSGFIKALAGPVPASGPASGYGNAAWGTGSMAGSGCVVAVLDTGVDARPRVDGWLSGVADSENVEPIDGRAAGSGHGTFVAGIVQQVAPDATVRAYRVMDADGVGSDARVAAAMLRAAGDGAAVLNLSLGTRTVRDEPPIAFEAALGLLAERHPETLVVAAAGNDGGDRPCWPAAFRDVAAVAGLSVDAEPSDWSNHGDWVTCSAVAEDVVSTFVEGERAVEGARPTVFGPDPWARWTGTSFAAPQVSAAVAQGCADDGVTPREAFAALLSGRPTDPAYGATLNIL